ncbi:hypothetical protein [Dyadobacter psychrophilus]|uniref:Uncharacterized protein n=1 Tax=Dyadobacter psychrophilus TaxID=651661 RepID=A0A1T5HD13_9BACT|nr:hypothetical protein [Dyadobacter psychrophilus]SKC18544.1 hypothetical protein SAMN05660293_05327 [Dyadobacter psychrophilus]
MQEINYPLHWLDWAVTEMFKADKAAKTYLTAMFCRTIAIEADRQYEKQRQFLRRKSFELSGKNKNQYLKNYHNALVLLYDQAMRNEQYWQGESAEIATACKALSACIFGVLHTAEMSLHGPPLRKKVVGYVLLQAARDQLIERFSGWMKEVCQKLTDPAPLGILRDAIQQHLAHQPGRSVMETDLIYHQRLIAGLTQMQIHEQASINQNNLHNLLIGFNFNNADFIRFYTGQIALQIQQQDFAHSGLVQLQFFYKEFCQIQMHSKRAFDDKNPDIKKVIGSWFEQEVHFARLYSKQVANSRLPLSSDGKPFKVLCFLSVDQIAIILRSMDALRIFQAKSLVAIMQSLAPYLSTSVKADISWQSMRSKSYTLEENDRKVVISTLQSMIKWIEEYQNR